MPRGPFTRGVCPGPGDLAVLKVFPPLTLKGASNSGPDRSGRALFDRLKDALEDRIRGTRSHFGL